MNGQTVTLHITNIFKERELEEEAVCKDSLLTAKDGKKYKTKLYCLDVIISVGYRVKSLRGTQFRIWANRVLKDYLLKGYVINQRVNIRYLPICIGYNQIGDKIYCADRQLY